MLLLIRGIGPRCAQSRLPAACARRAGLPTSTRFLRQVSGEAASREAKASGQSDPSTHQSPVLRFAPSPTGQLHLGGLRTALFNHLYARSKGGKWILRIEDTDQKRYVPGAVEAMQDVLRWSGLDYDEGPDRPGSRGPYVQSQRLHLYKAYAERLLDSGHAYRDFRAAEEKADEDENGKEAGQGSKSGRIKQRYVPPSEEAAQKLIAEGRPHVIRLRSRSAESKTYEFKDVVYGTLHLSTDSLGEDPILVKSDGWPTYHLANVVDDLEMGITHVFRGEEWIPSMPTHLALYEALGKAPPQFVHLPLLVNADGSKLSKRENDVHVESFRSQNYEPEALINFVALLGHNWHHATQAKLADNEGGKSKSDRTVFTMEELIKGFSLDGVSKSRACPDIGKLQSLNRHHLARKLDAIDPKGRVKLVNSLMEALDSTTPPLKFVDGLEDHQVEQLGATFLSRSHDINSAYDAVVHLFSDVDLDSDEARAYWESLNEKYSEIACNGALEVVRAVKVKEYETPKQGKAVMGRILTEFQVGMKKLAKTEHVPQFGRPQLFHPLRLALTGRKGGPPLQEILIILGKSRTIARLERAVRHLEERRKRRAAEGATGDEEEKKK